MKVPSQTLSPLVSTMIAKSQDPGKRPVTSISASGTLSPPANLRLFPVPSDGAQEPQGLFPTLPLHQLRNHSPGWEPVHLHVMVSALQEWLCLQQGPRFATALPSSFHFPREVLHLSPVPCACVCTYPLQPFFFLNEPFLETDYPLDSVLWSTEYCLRDGSTATLEAPCTRAHQVHAALSLSALPVGGVHRDLGWQWEWAGMAVLSSP